MGLWLTVVRVCAVANVLLLLALTAVWVRNYRQFQSKHTLGLAIFGALLLAENGLAVYYFLLHPNLAGWFADPANMPGPPAQAMMVLRLLETGALLFLGWITWD